MAALIIPLDLDPTRFPVLASSNVNETQAKIDDNVGQLNARIRSLEEMIRAWYTRRNEFAPISRLPKEVLAQIFIHLRNDLVRNTSIYRPHGANGWVWVAGVCQYWRQVAFEARALWAHINMTRFLQRHVDFYEFQALTSWPSPVTLTATVCLPGERSLLINLVTREPRMYFSQADLSGSNLGQALSALTSSSTTLHSLILRDTDEVSNILFAGATPRLQVLQMIACSGIIWDAEIFQSQSLRRFTLEDLKESHRPSSNQLQQIMLALSPTLEELKIAHSLPIDAPALSGRDEPHLTRLKSLKVTDRSLSVINFLASLRVPSTTAIEADMNGVQTIPDDFAGRTALAQAAEANFLGFFGALSACRSSPLECVRLSLESMKAPDSEAMMFVNGMLAQADDKALERRPQAFKMTYLYTEVDLRFDGASGVCGSCNQKVHSVFTRGGRPRQLYDVSLCTSCRGPCHPRLWFPTLSLDGSAIPGLCFKRLEHLELRQSLCRINHRTQIPPTFWAAFSVLPNLRQITLGGYCLGEFGELWQNNKYAFPALKCLTLDGVLQTTPSFIKKLQNGLELRYGDADRRLHSLEFTDNCKILSMQDIGPVLGQYLLTLKAPAVPDHERSAHPRVWQWPPPPEETHEDHFKRVVAQMGYSDWFPLSPADCRI